MQGAHLSDSRHRLGGLRLRHVSAESRANLRSLRSSAFAVHPAATNHTTTDVSLGSRAYRPSQPGPAVRTPAEARKPPKAPWRGRGDGAEANSVRLWGQRFSRSLVNSIGRLYSRHYIAEPPRDQTRRAGSPSCWGESAGVPAVAVVSDAIASPSANPVGATPREPCMTPQSHARTSAQRAGSALDRPRLFGPDWMARDEYCERCRRPWERESEWESIVLGDGRVAVICPNCLTQLLETILAGIEDQALARLPRRVRGPRRVPALGDRDRRRVEDRRTRGDHRLHVARDRY